MLFGLCFCHVVRPWSDQPLNFSKEILNQVQDAWL